jgi:hypothetical protein
LRSTDNEREGESHRRKETTYKYPYSLFISQERTVTETFSMGKREAWMFREEKRVLEPELILIEEVNMNWSTSIDVGVHGIPLERLDKRPSG